MGDILKTPGELRVETMVSGAEQLVHTPPEV